LGSERVSGQTLAGGYFLVKPAATLAPGLLTASSCLVHMAPDCWAIEWVRTTEGEREDSAARLGIRADDIPAVIRWATDSLDKGDFAWPNLMSFPI
jgi:hypothetical protein